MEYNCFTMVFILYKEVNLLHVYIYPLPRGPPSHHPHPTLLGHHREQGWAPCASQQLSILHMCVCVFSSLVMSNSLQPHGLKSTRLLCPWGFSRPEYWSRLPCPPPGDLTNPGIKPRSPTLQADSLPSKPSGKPKNIGVGSLSLLQGIFLTQESNRGLLHYRQILYQLSYQGSLL